ncbi:Uncharacterized protein BP5553_04340 [Venustampulla echinocandica]|uniref:Major facilitator superfamily (MFS) profile domain-containing protein n=1 Tax=Venustampulla echinocandica TaxID=2656787 RepID=A0A370TWU9_9HELO|nr:Uncharacterized protein BP5553_04340 [Venustampulla echinocandica]RDL40000.1 Uncharacterized protein BP5553_04340 [Venustampulla echinocandica]
MASEKPENVERQAPSEPERPEDNISSDGQVDNAMVKREPMTTWRLTLVLACIGVGLFLSLLDTTVVATMLTAISEDFGGFRDAPWIILAYTLSYVGFAVALARVSDVVGRKAVVCVSFFIFLVASLACGFATSLEQLIGFRAVQGIGGAGLYAMAMIIYPEVTPPGLVPAISAVIGLIVALAGVSGPIIGGLLTTYSSWRGPCALIPGVVFYFCWPNNFQALDKVQFRHLDYVGIVLVMLGTVLPVFIANQAAVREYAWNSATSICILVLSGLTWVILLLWQWQLSRNPRFRLIRPQLPFRLITDPVMASVFVCTFLAGFIIHLSIISIPLRAQIVNVYDAVKSGILLLPLMGGMAVGSALGGAVSAKRNLTFWTLNLASIFMLIGSALMSTIPGTLSPAARQWAFEAILGLGLGLNLSSSTLMTSLQAEFEDYSIAQGLTAQMRLFGGSAGVAASFTVLNTKIHNTLGSVLSPEQLNDFYKSPVAILSFTIAEKLEVRETYIEAFAIDMRICIGISVASLLVSICTYQRDPPSIKKRLGDLEKFHARGVDIPVTEAV